MAKEEGELKILEFDANKNYPDALEAVEKLHAWAKNGDIIGFAAFAIMKDRQIAQTATKGVFENIYLSIGFMNSFLHELMHEADAMKNFVEKK